MLLVKLCVMVFTMCSAGRIVRKSDVKKRSTNQRANLADQYANPVQRRYAALSALFARHAKYLEQGTVKQNYRMCNNIFKQHSRDHALLSQSHPRILCKNNQTCDPNCRKICYTCGMMKISILCFFHFLHSTVEKANVETVFDEIEKVQCWKMFYKFRA